MNVRVVRALRGCVRTLPSPKGLVIFFHFTQGLRPGLLLFRPCGAWILRNHPTVQTQNEFSQALQTRV